MGKDSSIAWTHHTYEIMEADERAPQRLGRPGPDRSRQRGPTWISLTRCGRSLVAQTKVGAEKINARRLGMTLEDYQTRNVAEKWCTGCKDWHNRSEFWPDASRSDGLSSGCKEAKRRSRRIPLEQQKPKGPAPMLPRDGDRLQARQRINVEIRAGHWRRPNSLPCTDCGHLWSKGERRHEYDHYLGYAAEHHYDVEAVCTECHARREVGRRDSSHCANGHEFGPDNTGYQKGPQGMRRVCLDCRRSQDRGRRDAAYWRAYRARRKDANNG